MNLIQGAALLCRLPLAITFRAFGAGEKTDHERCTVDPSGAVSTTLSVRGWNEVGFTARRANVDGLAQPSTSSGTIDSVYRRVRGAGCAGSDAPRNFPDPAGPDTDGGRWADDHYDRRNGAHVRW